MNEKLNKIKKQVSGDYVTLVPYLGDSDYERFDDEVDWLIETIEQQQKEIEELQSIILTENKLIKYWGERANRYEQALKEIYLMDTDAHTYPDMDMQKIAQKALEDQDD